MVGGKPSKSRESLDSKALKHGEDGARSGGIGVSLSVWIFEISFGCFKTLLELFFNIGVGIEGINEAVVTQYALMGRKFWGFPKRK